jgi:Putative Actinobacterial Holin-X, holin superfamily III
MADHLKNSALPRLLSDVVGDLADLFQKEMRLARAELSEKLSLKIQAGVWMSVAAAFILITLLAVVEALIFGIASGFGIALHWSCLIVAGLFAAIAGAAYAKGHANAQEDISPDRTIYQVKQDIRTAKEQLK